MPPVAAATAQIDARGVHIRLPLKPQEQIFGFGLQLLSFNQRGKKKTIRVNADPKLDTGDSHAPVPFYVSTQGYGVFVDTARYATFYVGSAKLKPRAAEASAENTSPDPNYTETVKDVDDGQIIVEIPRSQGVDVYLFAGPGMLDAVRRYNVFSGGGAMVPEWGLGFWYRSESRATDQEALALAKEFRERKIPCDVFGLEPGWQTHAYSCTYAWTPERFPDSASFLRSMQQMNYRVNLWEHAFTHPGSPIFSELRPYAGDYGVWGGLVPDFEGEPARRIFGNYHGLALVEAGVSGFKLDECDNSDFTGGWSFPEMSQFPSGADGEQMHNLFGLRYQHAIWEAFRSRNQLTYGMVRSSGALAAPYPFVLYSDLYNHRDFVRALVNSGFSGLLWTPEVRDAANEEDLIRRLQSVVFSPLAIVNCWYMKSPPWRQLNKQRNNAGEAMANWETVEERCREIIGWRMSLLPYLSSAMEQYVKDGTPPFRALTLDFPSDVRFHKVDDQFMVGDRLMVAPLFAGEEQRSVLIPEGDDWHDFWTGAPVKAGSKLTISNGSRDIPVFIKAGSVIPWAEVGLHTGTPESRRLTVRIYGSGERSFRLPDKTELSWLNKRGTLNGKGEYTVVAWQHLP
jgi:alpha-D-xyloside xylohydrolase